MKHTTYCSADALKDSEQNLEECFFSPEGASLTSDSSPDDLAFRSFLDQKAAQRKLVRKSTKRPKENGAKQRRANKTPETEWLRDLICPFVYGEKTPDGIRPRRDQKHLHWPLEHGHGPPLVAELQTARSFQGTRNSLLLWKWLAQGETHSGHDRH